MVCFGPEGGQGIRGILGQTPRGDEKNAFHARFRFTMPLAHHRKAASRTQGPTTRDISAPLTTEHRQYQQAMATDEEYRELEDGQEEEAVGFNFSVGVWNELIGEDIQYKVREGGGRKEEGQLWLPATSCGKGICGRWPDRHKYEDPHTRRSVWNLTPTSTHPHHHSRISHSTCLCKE